MSFDNDGKSFVCFSPFTHIRLASINGIEYSPGKKHEYLMNKMSFYTTFKREERRRQENISKLWKFDKIKFVFTYEGHFFLSFSTLLSSLSLCSHSSSCSLKSIFFLLYDQIHSNIPTMCIK